MTDHAVLWTHAARDDLQSILDHIAEDSVAAAIACLDRIERRCESLVSLARRGRVVPELGFLGVPTYRGLIEGPWRIIYRYDDAAVRVMAVLDARRNLARLLLERLVR